MREPHVKIVMKVQLTCTIIVICSRTIKNSSESIGWSLKNAIKWNIENAMNTVAKTMANVLCSNFWRQLTGSSVTKFMPIQTNPRRLLSNGLIFSIFHLVFLLSFETCFDDEVARSTKSKWLHVCHAWEHTSFMSLFQAFKKKQYNHKINLFKKLFFLIETSTLGASRKVFEF